MYPFQRKKIFNLIVQNSYEELAPYNIDFMGLLKNYFPVEFRKPANFKAEVDGPDNYKILYYSIKYPSVVEHILEGHTALLNSVNFSPDGSKVLTTSFDNTAKIWNTESGALLHILDNHTDNVRFANFSPDGLRIIAASSDNTGKTWKTLYKVLSSFSLLSLFTNLLDFAVKN